ncbi:MAG: hypothetical protein P1P83_14065, partial [Bacteroidales bacterium]|nr:hypothetical protein [Bacteroidales bacterium]
YSHRKCDLSVIKEGARIIDLNEGAGLRNENGNLIKDVISGLDPDVIIMFGLHLLDVETYDIPTYGVWAFSTENNEFPGEPVHGFLEVIKHKPLTNTVLEIVKADRSENEVIYSSRESTYHYSVTVNRNRVFWRATLILPRIIEGLARYGENYLDQLKERQKEIRTDTGLLSGSYSFLTVLRDLTVHIARVLALGFNKLIYTDAFSWKLLTDIRKDSNSFSDNFRSFDTLNPPRKMFWADPFVVAENNNYYIFVEEFIYRKNRAHISLIELDSGGRFIRSGKIIERPYHMSYPFAFKLGDSYYMIPETSQNRTIELYKCTEFPWKWEFERNIMEDISATDATLFYHEEKWWLFATVDRTNGISGCSTELFLFFSEDPFSGRWTSHFLNPVVSDESNARCAGKLFVEDGRIYRPTQDCSVRYGRGFNINLVTKLSTGEYNETPVREIKPDWNRKLKGTHTLNYDGGLTVIDIYRYHGRLALK